MPRTRATRSTGGAVGLARTALIPLFGDSSPESPLAAVGKVGHGAVRTAGLILSGRLLQPRENVGRIIAFADGTSAAVYRETVVDRLPIGNPVFSIVGFELRLVHSDRAHALFRAESLLNTVLFAGFPGLGSKLWLRHDQNGVYRGLYEWDGPDLALRYVNALWWVLGLVSVRDSVRYAILPGLGRDEALAAPEGLQGLPGAAGAWWRPVAVC